MRRRRVRIIVVEALAVGEQDGDFGLHQIGDQRGQRVVVAEADFVVDHRVVLVDDRNDAERQQRAQRVARVQVALAVGEIGVGQKHLRGDDAETAEGALITLRQPHLPDRGRGLQLVQFGRARLPAHALHALHHRARRHQQNLRAVAAAVRPSARPAKSIAALFRPASGSVSSEVPTLTTQRVAALSRRRCCSSSPGMTGVR